jgi:hypothetical protein
MVGSFAEAFGPAAFFLRRPIRVVGCGGGSYLGFSFCRQKASVSVNTSQDIISYGLKMRYDKPSLTCRLFRPCQAGLHLGQMVDCPETRLISKLQDTFWRS